MPRRVDKQPEMPKGPLVTPKPKAKPGPKPGAPKTPIPAKMKDPRSKRLKNETRASSHRTVKERAREHGTPEEIAEANELIKMEGDPAHRGGFIPGKPNTAGGRKRRLFELIEPVTERCVNTLVTIMEDEKVLPGVRIEAASRLLDRGYGKPKEHVEVDDKTADASKMERAHEQLEKIRAEITAEREAMERAREQ